MFPIFGYHICQLGLSNYFLATEPNSCYRLAICSGLKRCFSSFWPNVYVMLYAGIMKKKLETLFCKGN